MTAISERKSPLRRFTSFHELITRRISEILLVSSPYDAFIMQEDGPLSERIIHEYRGLNLSRPPRLTWISEGKKALTEICSGHYDLIIIMPHIGDMTCHNLCARIHEQKPNLPIYYFAYDPGQFDTICYFLEHSAFTRTLLWSGDTDLLLAIVKSEEDAMNVAHDTEVAGIRVIIFIEDSPIFLSSLLPVLYRELVGQTLAIMDDSLNEREKLLRMRTRPKILLAENYEQARQLYEHYRNYLFCVISDIRFPKEGEENPRAGFDLLSQIREEMPDIPLLALSSEESNRQEAEAIPALFSDKNSARLHKDIAAFFRHSLGFGDFFFRTENGEEVGRAKNLSAMANVLKTIPLKSFAYHAGRNDFSRWLMARFEMEIAREIRPVMLNDFKEIEEARDYLVTIIRKILKRRQRGQVTDFVHDEFDPEHDFVKIGTGSLGGKARGLAFFSSMLSEGENLLNFESDVEVTIPKTLVISTEGFDLFASENNIFQCITTSIDDTGVVEFFRNASFPAGLREDLRLYLQQTTCPLAVRSSALLEDAHFRASAGAYNTFMLPNNNSDIEIRLKELIDAVKLIYSSIFLEAPRQLARSSIYRQEDEKMGVVIQHLVGSQHETLFYPAVSGVAQSHNFYPIAEMASEDGVAHIAMGLGKTVVDGGVALRFCPKYPQLLPQFSTVDDILKNAQRYFYALEMASEDDFTTLLRRVNVDTVPSHYPVTRLASSYDEADGRLRDFYNGSSAPVLTFAPLLKYGDIPLGDILTRLLAIGEAGMGCPVEIEFALDLLPERQVRFHILQIRPMAVAINMTDIDISAHDRQHGWCYSDMAMGQSQERQIDTIVFVRHDLFDNAKTREIAREIAQCNATFKATGQRYLLIGPGRWGSADRWLGIPVTWNDISQAHTIIESTTEQLHAEPSQGSHFFHNLTSLGINYLVVTGGGTSFLDTLWLTGQDGEELGFLKVIRLENPATLKIDGTTSQAVLLHP